MAQSFHTSDPNPPSDKVGELDDKLREILQTPHRNNLGETVMTFPTPKTLAQIKQAFEPTFHQKQVEEVQAIIDHSFGDWNGADYAFDRLKELNQHLRKQI